MGPTRPPTELALQPARWIRGQERVTSLGSRPPPRQMPPTDGVQYKSPDLSGDKAGASIFGRAARYTCNSSGRYALIGCKVMADEALRSDS
jgi:hypothetical protein